MKSYSLLQIACLRKIASQLYSNIINNKKTVTCCNAKSEIEYLIKKYWENDCLIWGQKPFPIQIIEEYRLALTVLIIDNLLKTNQLFHECSFLTSLEKEVEVSQNSCLVILFYFVTQRKMLREINEVEITWNTVFFNDNCYSCLKPSQALKLTKGNVSLDQYQKFKRCHFSILNMANQDFCCLQYAMITYKNN
jgi:hypothetical protein